MLRLSCLSLLISVNFFSQNAFQDRVKGESEKYTKKANKAFRRGAYKDADSLFSVSLSINPNAEIYKSRALARKASKNYDGFCDDLVFALKYGDIESGNEFKHDCIVGNAFYIDSMMRKATRENYYFSLNFIKYKYRNQQEYYKMNNKSELIEGYRTINTDTLYYYILPSNNDYSPDMKELINYVSNNISYPQSEFISGISGTVYTEITINVSGKIIKVDILYSPSIGFANETKRVLNNAPHILPFQKKGRLVKSIMTFPVNFILPK
jgi:hypothetical protein